MELQDILKSSFMGKGIQQYHGPLQSEAQNAWFSQTNVKLVMKI